MKIIGKVVCYIVLSLVSIHQAFSQVEVDGSTKLKYISVTGLYAARDYDDDASDYRWYINVNDEGGACFADDGQRALKKGISFFELPHHRITNARLSRIIDTRCWSPIFMAIGKASL